MNASSPRDILSNLIQSYGQDLADDPQRLENLLRDLCPEHPLEIAVLVNATKAGVHRIFTTGQAQTSQILSQILRLKDQLVDRQGLTETNALWAVESWALALGVIPAQQCTTPPYLAPALTPSRGVSRVRRPRREQVDRYYRAWKEDLLDYSRRNPLLYYRPTKTSSLEILEPGIDTLYQKLYLRSAKLTFPQYRMEIIPTGEEETRYSRHQYRYVLEKHGHLVSDKEEGALMRALANLRNRARSSRTELGLNTLYLALGLLRWTDPGRSDETAYAPLVLVPVNIERTTGKGRYSLVYFDEEIVVNPTLRSYMGDPRIGYSLEIPEFQTDADDLASFKNYLDGLSRLATSRGWSVEDRAVLRSFSFHTIRMAEDLEKAREQRYYPGLVRMLARETQSQGPTTTAGAMPAADLDAKIHPRDLFQVLDADASQLSALAAAQLGDHLVIHGPPGTGKSQTIVNLIAQSVAAGKKVLFVSQKNAALEVVYRRLMEIGLDIFCLPVHSDRANKRSVLDEIQCVYNPPPAQATGATPQAYDSLYRQRLRLNQLAEELNRPLGLLNWNVQTVQGHLFRLRDIPDIGAKIGLKGFSYLEVDDAEWQAKREAAQRLVAAYHRLAGPPDQHPWRNLTRQTTPAIRAEIRASVDRLHGLLKAVEALRTDGATTLRLPVPGRRSELLWLIEVAGQLARSPTVRRSWFLGADLEMLLREAEAGRVERETILDGRAALEQAGASRHFYQLDHIALRQQLVEAQETVVPYLPQPYASDDPATRDRLATVLQGTLDLASKAKDLCERLSAAIGMRIHPTDRWLMWGGQLAQLCASGVRPAALWFDLQRLDQKADIIESAALTSQQCREARARIQESWIPEALSLDPVALSQKRESFQSPVRRLIARAYRDWRREMTTFWQGAKSSPTYTEIAALITDLQRVAHARRWYERHAAELHEIMGAYYRGVETDHGALKEAMAQSRSIVEHFGDMPIPSDVRVKLSSATINPAGWVELQTAVNELLSRLGATISALDRHLKPTVYRPQIQSNEMVHFGKLIRLSNQMLGALRQIDGVYDQAAVHLALSPPVPVEVLDEKLRMAHEVLDAEAKMRTHDANRRELLGPNYRGLETDWDGLVDVILYTQNLKRLLLNGDPDRDLRCPGGVKVEFFAEQLSPSATLRREAARIETRGDSLVSQFDAAFHGLAVNFASDDPVLAGPGPSDLPFARLTARTQELSEGGDRLNDWQHYMDSLAAVETCGLTDVARETIDEKKLPVALLKEIVEKRFYQLWLSEAYTQVEYAGQLQSERLGGEIAEFCQLDEALLIDQRLRVRRAWEAKRPKVSASVPNSQAGILTREFQKQRAHMPLRRLFGELPELILALKPCMLMSPLSVAAYLDLETFYRRFDLVVFDEASQVRPAYAVGALLRAKQAVVVGDTKQLPPTDFFRVAREMDEYVEDAELDEALPPESLESILGEFITMPGVRQTHLLWHYRSRHEALIQFSNRRYYNDRLITFPAPLANSHSHSLECVRVDGVYDRGNTRQNQDEAREVVRLIDEHLRTYGTSRTLGVITMSTAQEQAIRDELQYQKIAANLPALQQHQGFLNEDAHTPEPFFIKSLERVQGDERDSIIISIGYGPDAEGRIYQNFGPLVMEGGERRLNVAITRAKHDLTLVTSLKPDDIQISEESKPGLVHLKEYIAYVQDPRPKAQQHDERTGGVFEQAVQKALEGRGYEVDSGIGTGIYTIDLAIRHPEMPDRYLLGIESDGRNYVNAATARDRHRLRRQMLENVMGWRLQRIWSKPWAERPHLILDDLQTTIATLLSNPIAAQAAAPPSPTEPSSASPDRKTMPQPGVVPTGTDPDDDSWQAALRTETYTPYQHQQAYTMEQYYEDESLRDEIVLAIVRAEEPVHEAVFLERLEAAFQFGRATAKFKQAGRATLQKLSNRGDLVVNRSFLSTRREHTDITPRVPAPGTEPRRLAHICIAEIAELCRQICGQIYGIHQEALARQATRVFGHKVLTRSRKARVLEAIRHLEHQGTVVVNNEYVFLA